ncbi:SDR family NAD(P)-dependent oxidoreductase [Chitinophaga lutea]
MEKLLQNKVAVVYGAGFIAGAVARAFAQEGASVFIGARTAERASALAENIRKAGGAAETGLVDVLDEASVKRFTDQVVEKAGRIDISFCATNVPGGKQGAALSEISWEDFSVPLLHYTQSQFHTANAASRHMVAAGKGVILMITAIPSHMPIAYTTGFGPAWAALEALSRTLAAELGPHGIRTVCLHSAGSPESQPSIDRSFLHNDVTAERMKNWKFVHMNLLGKHPTLEQVGNMAVFMASNKAGVTTGALANISGGMVTI